jgi:Fur family peroxide stress response transcriptional regulator
VNRSKAQIVAEMREKGLRVTPQREAILDYLLATDEHPSVRQIWEAAQKSVPGISLSTVYSSVSELSRLGLVKELEFNEVENRYEGNLSHHINLICTRCGSISDYMTAHTIDMDHIRETTRFRASQSRFELYGVCAKCAKK